MPRTFSSRTAPIFPLVLLTVGLLEEVVWYLLRREIPSVWLRVVLRIVLVGSLFSFAAEVVEPRLRKAFTSARALSRRALTVWHFYLVAYGIVFAAYYVLETRGVRALVP